jgi:hypothetical protein
LLDCCYLTRLSGSSGSSGLHVLVGGFRAAGDQGRCLLSADENLKWGRYRTVLTLTWTDDLRCSR